MTRKHFIFSGYMAHVVQGVESWFLQLQWSSGLNKTSTTPTASNASSAISFHTQAANFILHLITKSYANKTMMQWWKRPGKTPVVSSRSSDSLARSDIMGYFLIFCLSGRWINHHNQRNLTPAGFKFEVVNLYHYDRIVLKDWAALWISIDVVNRLFHRFGLPSIIVNSW